MSATDVAFMTMSIALSDFSMALVSLFLTYSIMSGVLSAYNVISFELWTFLAVFSFTSMLLLEFFEASPFSD